MYQFILLIHVFAAVFIVALVLVQQGKGAAVGAAFGSGASQTVFGSRGSGSFLFRLTVSLVAIFFITSISLNYMASRAYKEEKTITLPIAPAPAQRVPTSVPQVPSQTTPEQAPINSIPIDLPTAPAKPGQANGPAPTEIPKR